MATYISNGKELLDVEYDDIVEINDTVDGMRVISKDVREDEYAVFMLEPNGNICCYVFDEVFIIGRVSGFETLPDAIKAWKNEEI
ncbi:MAG: hypothetical protein OQK48_02075 [Sulfurimonas sp.]|uniref:hypothetical protein n=1 Tax=Sulfurimonas sp. TaxID=2022749 RepID=UPI002610289D|nr:hypothetical protein [Sulfurimonas sp.]MCW8894880.1 hypothetical protein [Sulfurimonas sp.]MCW8953710.1 hypothetical protein [Sulfurimonas sp.]MCW9067734.1 hypothetical protein [Sulfurimonas sp.]